MFQAILIIFLLAVIALVIWCAKLLKENNELKGNIVELHDKLPESYETDGYRYIGMRFQNEIKPYIKIDEGRKRISLKVVIQKEEK